MFIKNSTIAPLFQYILYLLLIVGVGLSIYYLIYIGNKRVEEDRQININWRRLFQGILILLLIVTIAYLYRKYPILGNTTFALFLSVILAFLLNPIVNKFENMGLKRSTGTLITYLIIIVVLVLLGISIIPNLINQASIFFNNLPSSINNVLLSVDETLRDWNIDSSVLNNLRKNVNQALIDLASRIPDLTSGIISTVQGSISTLVVMVLIPIMSYFFITDKDKILKKFYNLIPEKSIDDVYYLYKVTNYRLNDFVKSRLLMAVFVGVSTWIMLEIFGIPFAMIIGILTLIGDIIPYVGPVIATLPALIFAFIQSPMTFVWVAILCYLLQWIEQNIVGAKLMSSSSGIHEIVILLSIIIGGGIFGVWGMILSIPTIIIIDILINYSKLKIKGIKPVFNEADFEKKEPKKKSKTKKNIK